MPTHWLDDTYAEDLGLFGSEEGYFDDEGLAENYDDDGESARDHRRPKAQGARQLALRRAVLARARQRRMAPPRLGPAPTTTTAVRKTQAAVQELDLRNKVQTDSFAGALAARDRRIAAAELGLVGNAVQAQLKTSLGALFPDIADNPVLKVGLPLAPLLLLKPPGRGSGVEGLFRDPRVLGGALVVGLAVTEAIKGTSHGVSDIKIASVDSLSIGTTSAFSAVAVDGKGKIVPNKSVRWDVVTSNPQGAVSIVSDTGVVTATAEGSGIISASVDGVESTVAVTVGP